MAAGGAAAERTIRIMPAGAGAEMGGRPSLGGGGGRAEAPAASRMRPVLDWRPFLRALAEEIDAVAGVAGRDGLLHGVGLQLARMHPVPPRESLDALALEMTETLESFGWGRVRIEFSGADGCLFLTHEGLPQLGGGGEPPGSWLAGVLAGLYEGWMAQQAGADETLVARRVAADRAGEVVVRYGRE